MVGGGVGRFLFWPASCVGDGGAGVEVAWGCDGADEATGEGSRTGWDVVEAFVGIEVADG